MLLKLYADGSVQTRKRTWTRRELPAGWACIITDPHGNVLQELSDSVMTMAVDRVELFAIQRGLQIIHAFSPDADNHVDVFSDSRYALKALFDSIPVEKRGRFCDDSSFTDQLLETAPHIDQERDADIRKILQQILLKTITIAFHKVQKANAPKEHGRCDRLAAECRIQLATQLGYPVGRMISGCSVVTM